MINRNGVNIGIKYILYDDRLVVILNRLNRR